MIDIKNLSVQYDQDVLALKNINLSFDHGCYVIVGKNGSGKSTLLQTIVGIVDKTGEINIDGLVVEKRNLIEIRKKVGFVFQNPDHQLFMSRIYDDIAFGLVNQKLPQNEIEQRVQAIAKQLHLESLLNRSCHKLSGGQKRLAAIASVLVMDPDIILMDEPSSFLDPESRRKIIQLIQSLSKTLIIVTHDLDMALDIADYVILLNEGNVVSQGKPEDILTNKELLEANGLELPYCYQR